VSACVWGGGGKERPMKSECERYKQADRDTERLCVVFVAIDVYVGVTDAHKRLHARS